jgi:hypothetical protein
MKLLFKILNSIESTKATVANTTFKNHYPDVNKSTPWVEIEPYVSQSTKLYIIPFIGIEMYNKVAEEYHSTAITDEVKLTFIEMLQDCIAYYTIYHSLPQKAVAISSMGLNQNNTTESTARPLSISDIKNLKYDTHLKADAFLDMLLAYLEHQSDDDYFDEWRASSASKYKTTLLFKHTSELDEYLNIQNSRRAFVSLTPYINKAEEDALLPIIGEALIEILKSDLNDESLKLQKLSRKFVVEAALIQAIPNLTFIFEGDGLRIISKGDSVEERNSLKHQQHENAILRRLQKAEENAARYRTELIDFLMRNKDSESFQTWKESDFYKSLISDTSTKIITSDIGAIML